jgi:DNA-binding response OmpR family regulator
MSRRVLIVEDDPDIAALVAMHLKDIDCEAEIASNGKAGLDAYKARKFDLVVLDLMLPGLDGLSICREIRATGDYVPILILTAKSSELDRVLGLEIGADDYLTKPFAMAELLARIKALLRRVEALAEKARQGQQKKRIEYDGLVVDVEKHKVSVKDRPVDLTAREFDLLQHFASHPGHVFTRAQLLDQVWGYNHEGYEHTVNTHINRLRAKIEADPASPRYILTVWGVGYKFAD